MRWENKGQVKLKMFQGRARSFQRDAGRHSSGPTRKNRYAR